MNGFFISKLYTQEEGVPLSILEMFSDYNLKLKVRNLGKFPIITNIEDLNYNHEPLIIMATGLEVITEVL